MKKLISVSFSVIMIFTVFINAFAIDSEKIFNMTNDTAQYLYKTVENPQMGTIGGEWTVIGLKRSEARVPEEYFEKYYNNILEYLKGCDGVVHKRKYTEYSRLIIALSAIGKDVQNIEGYNLLLPLADYEKTIWQGINGAVFALLAFDSKDYKIPKNPQATVQATKEMYINRILELQLPDGGWSLSSRGERVSDADITGMVLQSLSKYKENVKVNKAIEKALLCMSDLQEDDGGFSSFGEKNSESTVQMIIALCELGISLDDERFVKNGKTLIDSLERFYIKGNGFSHIIGGETDLMATEQGLCALSAIKRALEGKSGFYVMEENKLKKPSLASISAKAFYMLEQLLMEINR